MTRPAGRSENGEGQYEIRRELIGVRITLSRMAAQVRVTVATDAEVDTVLDQES